MGDPLSDPRAQGLLLADLGEISSLASSFHQVASQAHTAAAGLRGAQNDAHWTGAAADAFRTKLGKLPGDLDNVNASYGEVAGALNTYEAHLQPVQSRFTSLVNQLTDARSNLAGAQGQVATAQTNLTNAASAPHATSHTTAVVNAHAALNSANSNAWQLQQQVSGLEQRGYNLLDEFDTIRNAAMGKVSDAAGKAPSHHWWQSVASFVGNFVKDAALGIAHSVWDLISGKDIIAFIEHPGWDTLGTLVKDIAITASLVAMIAAPFAAPELAGLDVAEATAEGAEAMGEAAAGAGEAAAAGGEGAVAEASVTSASVSADGATSVTQATASAATEDGVTTTEATAETTTEEGGTSLGSVARGVNTWGNRVAFGGNAFGVGDDIAKGDYGAAAFDAAFMVAPNLGSTGKAISAAKDINSFSDALAAVPKAVDHVQGFGDVGTNLIHVGDDSAEELAKTAENVADYKTYVASGFKPSAAKLMAFSDGEVPALHVDWSTKAVNAANLAMHVGKPLAGSFDKLVTEPAADQLKQKLHLVPADG